MNKLENNNNIFESIKRIDEYGNEYWYARELCTALKYSEYRKFIPVLQKAIISCKNSGQNVNNHFAHMAEMVNIGSKAKREISDFKLSRYACYLIAQNGDSRKKVIALAQTYFAIQTRKMELSEMEYNKLSEDEKRIYQRNLTRKGNYSLNQTAKNAGVKNLDKFHNAGYKGLYNGETANSVHYEVGMEVRDSIKRLGRTMPENLPTPNKSLKELEKERIGDDIDVRIRNDRKYI